MKATGIGVAFLSEGIYLALFAAFRDAQRRKRASVTSDLVVRQCVNQLRRAAGSLRYDLYGVRDRDTGLPDEAVGRGPSGLPDEAAAAIWETCWAAPVASVNGGLVWSWGEALPWTDVTWASVAGATSDAASFGVTHADVRLLAIRLLTDAPRAIEMIYRAGAHPGKVILSLQSQAQTRRDGRPWMGSVNRIRSLGLARDPSPILRALYAFQRWGITRDYATAPMPMLYEQEAVRQAVRLRHDRVDAVHLLLAVASIDEQLRWEQTLLQPMLLPHHNAGRVLREAGADYRTMLTHVAEMGSPSAPLSDFVPEGRRSLVWTQNAADVIARLPRSTKSSLSFPGADQILAAILAEPDESVRTVLRLCKAPVEQIRRYIGEL